MGIVKENYLPAFLALCLLMGGASNGGFFENLLLQLLALAVAVAAFLSRSSTGVPPVDRYFPWLGLLLAIVVAIQFLPLSLSTWSSLPGREQIAKELALVGAVPAATFVTLSYHETIASLTWLLPALGMGLALIFRSRLDASRLAIVLLGCTFASISLGLVQFLGPKDSAAYLYRITNNGLMVGFFANANHMATLLLVSLPFLAALTRNAIEARPAQKRELMLLAIVLMGFILLGVALVGSLTGYALALPVLVLSGTILAPRLAKLLKLTLIPALVLGATVIVLTDEGGNVFAEEASVSQGGREQIFSTTLTAAEEFWPVGTGLGTFREVYDDFERLDTARPVYINHAHSDYLELVLELGILGVVAIFAFLAWWLTRLLAIWRDHIQDPFAKAAAVASGVMLLHSAWDYPLRTAALSAVFVFCCVLLARARSPSQGSDLDPNGQAAGLEKPAAR